MKTVLALLIAVSSLVASAQQPRVQYATVRGTKLYYEQHGKGMPLIILSGGGIGRSVRDFDRCVPLLSKNFRVILPDSPGQGKSEQPDTLTYELLTQMMSDFIDSLHVDSCYVMGWSDGGIAALMLAGSKADRVKKVIAVGANTGLEGALPPEIDVASVVPQALDAWGENNKAVITSYSKNKERDWKKMMNSFNAMWYQRKYFSDDLLGRITIPVMIALGDRDDIIVEHAVSMHRRIANSQLYIMPGTTHEVFAEQPQLISAIAIKFFK